MLSEHCENNHTWLKNNKNKTHLHPSTGKCLINTLIRYTLYSELPFPLMATYAYLWEFARLSEKKHFGVPVTLRGFHMGTVSDEQPGYESVRLGHTRPMWPVFDKARCSQVGSPPVQSKGKLEVLCTAAAMLVSQTLSNYYFRARQSALVLAKILKAFILCKMHQANWIFAHNGTIIMLQQRQTPQDEFMTLSPANDTLLFKD